MSEHTCRSEYIRRGGAEPGDRIVRCHLPAGHPGEHEEAETEVTWLSVEELLPDVLEGRIQPGRVFDRVTNLDGVPEGYRAMNERKSTAILISGRGSNLKAIIDAIGRRDLDASIAIVISNRADAPGLDHARQAGLETLVLSHTAYPTREDYDRALVAELRRRGVELVCLAGFMRLLSSVFVVKMTGSSSPGRFRRAAVPTGIV